MKASFIETPWLFLLLVAFALTLQQVRSDAGPDDYDVNKRQISVLARDGNLPYQGKRYMNDRKDKGGEYLSQDWMSRSDNVNNGEPIMFLNPVKRYVGALAKSGDLRFARQLQDKRDEVDTLIDELLTTEELRRLRLEALRDELMKEKLEAAEDEADVEKKSLASLARSGNLPFRSESKKSVSSLARAGLLRPSPFRDYDLDAFGKRGIASLARNGQLPSFGKRGGISSIMRNRMSLHKRSVDDNDTNDEDDIDNLINEIYENDGKRNIASLARTSNLPYYGKRNMASFVRSGGLSGLNVASKKSMFDDWVDNSDDKRSIPAFFRSSVPSVTPAEGKRYLGAFVASNRLPYSKQSASDFENKRNIGAMARNWNLPNSYRFGKRDDGENDFNDGDEFDTSKRYVAALLRQGPIPVGLDTNIHMEPRNFNIHLENGDVEDDDNRGIEHEEDKRHIGSIAAAKSYSAMRKKKSVTAEDQVGSPENKTNGFTDANHRDKRQAVVDFATPSDEYPMPVLQNAEVTDYDDSKMNSDQLSTRNKRYFAVRGGGKIPGGRLPQIGRSRSHNPNSGRRRH